MRAGCGDGYVDASTGEQCDDGNALDGDCCTSTCQNVASGTACADDGLSCSRDVCDGAGHCIHPPQPAGTACRPAAGTCDLAETCDGFSVTCPANAFLPDGTPCDDGIACTDGAACTGGVCGGGTVVSPCTDLMDCYKARDLKPSAFVEQSVAVTDEFGSGVVTARTPNLLAPRSS